MLTELDQVATSNTVHTEVVITIPPAGVGDGRSILLAVLDDDTAAETVTPTVVDTAGNLYTADKIIADLNHLRLTLLSAHDVLPLAAGDEITVNLINACFNSVVVALVATGLTAAPLDRTASQQGESDTPSTGATASTRADVELAFAVFGATDAAQAFTPDAGWTPLTEAFSAGLGLWPVYQVLSAAGPVEASGTFDTPAPYGAALATYYTETITMADPVGNLAKLGIGIEGTPGTPVDAQVYLDFVSETLKGEGAPIRSKAITGGRMVKKAVAGPYQWGGDVQMEVTPDKFSKLLYAALTGLSTVGTAAPYTHTLKTGGNLKPLTVHVYRPGPDGASEPCYFVYPGGYLESIEFRQSAEEILMATATLRGRAAEQIYDAAQEDGGIAFSSLDPFVFHQLAVAIGGQASVITSNWSLRINTGLITHRNLAGGRVPNRMFAGDSLISGSFELVFEDITQHRLFMGAAGDTSPITVGTSVHTQALSLEWTATAQRKLTLACGSMYYRASGPAVPGRDQTIIQPVEWEALYNASDASDIVATIINAESGATITGAGTNIS